MELGKTQVPQELQELIEKRKRLVAALQENDSHLDDILVGLYSDVTHFIYELLQNAEDAGATFIRFKLSEGELQVLHNGRDFDVSDIEAITNIGNGTKQDELNKIGKFGVGFKSVYAITSSPRIKSGNFDFEITDLMVPHFHSLTLGFEGTCLTFPFNHATRKPEQVSDLLHKKLRSLQGEEILFLNSLSSIEVSTLGSDNFTLIRKSFREEFEMPEPGKISATPAVDFVKISDSRQLESAEGSAKRYFKIYKPVVAGDFGNLETRVNLTVCFPLVMEESGLYAVSGHVRTKLLVYFATTRDTYLPVLLHAPFRTTPARDNVDLSNATNKELLTELADLLAQSLTSLKHYNLLSVKALQQLPLEDPDTYNNDDLYTPLYKRMMEELTSEKELLPTDAGRYVSADKALLARNNELPDFFSSEDLQVMFGRDEWLDRKVPGDRNDSLRIYLTDVLDIRDIETKHIAPKLTAQLLEAKPDEWLVRFYAFINKQGRALWAVGGDLRTKPIIRLEGTDKMISPYNAAGTAQVYLPANFETDYPTVKKSIYEQEEAREFLEALSLKQPGRQAEVDTYIIPRYKASQDTINDEQALADFIKVYTFLTTDCSLDQRRKYLKTLSSLKFIVSINNEGKIALMAPDEIYYPTEELTHYFESYDCAWFIKLDFYNEVEAQFGKESLKSFLLDLEVDVKVGYVKEDTPAWLTYERKRQYWTASCPDIRKYPDERFEGYSMHGLDNALKEIDQIKSFFIWESLIKELSHPSAYYNFFRSTYIWTYRKSDYPEAIESDNIKLLKNSLWLIDKEGNWRKPIDDLSLNDLAIGYLTTGPFARLLAERLGMKANPKPDGMNDADWDDLQRGRLLKEHDVSPEDIVEYLKNKRSEPIPSANEEGLDTASGLGGSKKRILEKIVEGLGEDESGNLTEENTYSRYSIPKPAAFTQEEDDAFEEQDELAPAAVNPAERRKQYEEQKLKEVSAQIDLEARRADVTAIAASSPMYSFAWFKALLELEDSFTVEDRVKKNPIRVSFGKAALDNDGILVLSEAAYIPQTIEDMGELQITLYSGGEKKMVTAEVVSPQNTTLKAKLRYSAALDGFDLNQVDRAVVEVSSADFILEKLKNAFARLDFEDPDNLHDQLPYSLQFVFGPPGTGKTTYLSRLIGGPDAAPVTLATEGIVPLMHQAEDKKVLVLTPTNKAADVLVEKVMENHLEQHSLDYLNWLIRFGETKSDTIMESGVFVNNREVPASVYGRCTLVTTIARFPYDHFKIQRQGEEPDKFELRDFYWDYIIFDEASMINLASLLYVVYYAWQRNPEVKFIIGGDPFQIHPVIKFEWEGWSYLKEPATNTDGSPKLNEAGEQVQYKQDAGNIYSMVGLLKDSSFTKPETTPYNFPVHNLTKQYRSIVPLGSLFSHYRYGGMLEHDRTETAMLADPRKAVKPIEVDRLPLQPLTIIHFPVKKYESIYRSRSIKGSPYHIYSALFVVELLKHMQANTTIASGTTYRVGVICPYRIQENIIRKLTERTCLGPLEIVTGTVHGFQGDQCDMVITVLSPPTKISRSTRTFLNKKNILNVAVSRAKDCLLLLVPQNGDGEVNVADLHQIERLKRIARTQPDSKPHVLEYQAGEIERALLGHPRAIEEFSFPTAHQSVNIYADPEKQYEIRFDEHAVDVQVKGEVFKHN